MAGAGCLLHPEINYLHEKEDVFVAIDLWSWLGIIYNFSCILSPWPVTMPPCPMMPGLSMFPISLLPGRWKHVNWTSLTDNLIPDNFLYDSAFRVPAVLEPYIFSSCFGQIVFDAAHWPEFVSWPSYWLMRSLSPRKYHQWPSLGQGGMCGVILPLFSPL